MKQEILRLPAEQLFQKEIDALIAAEKDPVPTGWKMSPRSVRTYICGGKDSRNSEAAPPLFPQSPGLPLWNPR